MLNDQQTNNSEEISKMQKEIKETLDSYMKFLSNKKKIIDKLPIEGRTVLLAYEKLAGSINESVYNNLFEGMDFDTHLYLLNQVREIKKNIMGEMGNKNNMQPTQYTDDNLTNSQKEQLNNIVLKVVNDLKQTISFLNNIQNYDTSIEEFKKINAAAIELLGLNLLTSKYDAEYLIKSLETLNRALVIMDVNNTKFSDRIKGQTTVGVVEGYNPSHTLLFNRDLSFFMLSMFGNFSQPGIILHEFSHFYNVLNTEDGAQFVDEIKNTLPEAKIKNAYSWQYFYERIHTGGTF